MRVYSQNFRGYIHNNWRDGWLLPEQTCYGWFKQHNVCLKKRCSGVNVAWIPLKTTTKLVKQTNLPSCHAFGELENIIQTEINLQSFQLFHVRRPELSQILMFTKWSSYKLLNLLTPTSHYLAFSLNLSHVSNLIFITGSEKNTCLHLLIWNSTCERPPLKSTVILLNNTLMININCHGW